MESNEVRRVLIADDDIHTRNLLRDLCEGGGCQAILTADGEAALAAASREKPCLALLDLMMPRLDGFAVLEKLRSADLTRDLPVIVLPAVGDVEGKLRGSELGADDYVTKPFRISDLQRRIQGVLDRQRYRDALKTSTERAAELRGDSTLSVGSFAELKTILENELSEACRSGRPLAALIVAVDEFGVGLEKLDEKTIHDRLGQIGRRLRISLRETDRVFRIDLEEFLIFMPDTPCAGAQIAAERLIRSVELESEQRTPPLTVSIGLATASHDKNEKLDDLVRLAHQALKQAQRAGRAQLVIAGNEGQQATG